MSTTRHRARRRHGNPFVVLAASLLIVSAVYYLNEWGAPVPPPLPDFEDLPQPEAFERGAARQSPVGGFDRLDGCILVENDRKNDGDSFLIRHGKKVHHFRIYFADCPEKQRHDLNEERLAEQGRYFRNMSEKETVAIGRRGRDATLHLLRNYPFSVFTKWEPVFDSERTYALVEIMDANRKKAYLHEILIGFGLARIHTQGVDLPNGTPRKEQIGRLQKLEDEAVTEGRGAWATRSE